MKNVQILIGWNRNSSAGKWETFCTLQHYSQWWLITSSLSHNCTHYFFLSHSLAESNTRPAFFNNIIRMKSNTSMHLRIIIKSIISVQDIFTLINTAETSVSVCGLSCSAIIILGLPAGQRAAGFRKLCRLFALCSLIQQDFDFLCCAAYLIGFLRVHVTARGNYNAASHSHV